MAMKLIQVRTTNAAVEDSEIKKLVEEGGGQFLPAPLIFPPMYMIKGSEELAEKLRSKVGSNGVVQVLQDLQD